MKRIVYVDMDNVLVDFMSAKPRVPERLWQRYEGEGRIRDLPGIFGLMDPMPGALEAFAELRRSFEAYILSTAPWGNPMAWSEKALWVRRYLQDLAYQRLILTHHKDLLRGDFLIDDRRRRGAAEFQGELIQFGSAEFPDWAAVLRHLRGRAGEGG